MHGGKTLGKAGCLTVIGGPVKTRAGMMQLSQKQA
jgi:hypothetical protein